MKWEKIGQLQEKEIKILENNSWKKYSIFPGLFCRKKSKTWKELEINNLMGI
jgi:hypothetical protein